MTAVWKSSGGGPGLGLRTNSFESRRALPPEPLRWHCRRLPVWMQRFVLGFFCTCFATMAALVTLIARAPHWSGVKWDQMPNWTPELSTSSSVFYPCNNDLSRVWPPEIQKVAGITIRGLFSDRADSMFSWLKGSSTLHQFQADLQQGSGDHYKGAVDGGHRGGRDTRPKNRIQVLALFRFTEADCDPADLCIHASVTHAHAQSDSRRCAAGAPLPRSLSR